MTATLPLILSSEPVQRGLLAPAKPSRPNVAVVYATGFGEVACFDGRPLSRSQQLMSKYRIRYEVDLSDHRRTAKLESSPLPALGDAYYFETVVDVGFRVVDPEAVVRRNVDDALIIVYSFLIECLRPITRRHDIQDAQGAEDEANGLFRQPARLPEGIEIYRCVARVSPDAAARRHIQSLVDAQRQSAVGSAQHSLAVASTQHEQQISAMQQQARLRAEEREQAAMADRPLDLPGLITMHLAKHPDETSYALELLSRHQQAQQDQRNIDDQRSMDLVRFMMERDLIQAVDVDRLRNQTLTRVQEIATTRPASLPPADWDDDLPAAVPGRVIRGAAESDDAIALAPASAPRQVESSPPTQAAPTDTALPVYLAIDESAADPAYSAALNNAIQGMIAQLAGSPAVVGALRVAILGFAGDVAVRMPMTTVGVGGYVPTIEPRDGGAGIGRLFDYLIDTIPTDIERLKGRGLTVSRPMLYLLAANTVPDGDDWRQAHQRLTDRAVFRYAPNIVACGIGSAEAAMIAEVTSRPELGFTAPAEMPILQAVAQYAAFLASAISQRGLAQLTGRPEAVLQQPAGFRRITETMTRDTN
ncbi:hypothetical protein KDK95_16555 [Actinospica sp. MGRD01-02]|uniref:VWFA domain-containing protein n=1 Tax=Actinospica acidithermotolerans TaxID=2828514 RepID=A0A941E7V0_9ACTN|nr:hypothetical protein [Actinospica acidithermotolerans]MBR7827930.1 hypothetical protein [Actinospica acidithermotolerans]